MKVPRGGFYYNIFLLKLLNYNFIILLVINYVRIRKNLEKILLKTRTFIFRLDNYYYLNLFLQQGVYLSTNYI